MNELNYRIFEPKTQGSSNDAILIFPNEIASGLEDTHGARARHYASGLGHRVLAYERPESAGSARVGLRIMMGSSESYEDTTKRTAQALRLVVEREGTDKLSIAGHSGGATEAISIASVGELPIKYGFFTDPPAIQKDASALRTLLSYGWYQAVTERRKPEDQRVDKDLNIPPEVELSSIELGRRVVGEVVAHRSIWQSSVALEGIINMIHKAPGLKATVTFPENTFTARKKRLDEITLYINEISELYGAQIRATLVPERYHSYYDVYQEFLDEYIAARDS